MNLTVQVWSTQEKSVSWGTQWKPYSTCVVVESKAEFTVDEHDSEADFKVDV